MARLLAAAIVASAPALARAQGAPPPEPPPPPPPPFLVDRLAAGISAGWFSSDELKYLARIHFDFPFFVARHKGLYVRGALASSISNVESDKVFRLEVEDVDYLFEAGARDYLTPRIAVAAFVGQQGSENLDRPGSARARYVGLGAQSSTFPRPGGESRFDWNFNLASVFETQEIEADWMVRGDALWDAIRMKRSSIGLDLSFDSLVDEGAWRSDWWVGPRLSFDLQNGIRTSLFARYLTSHNPLGVGASGLQVGFSYAEGAYRGERQGRLPDVRGVLAVGYGEERSPATFDVQAVFPPFHIAGRPARGLVDIDTDTIVGTGPDEAWYNLTGSAEVDALPSLVVNAGVQHRSYHQLADSVAPALDLNILYAGVRSPGWEFLDRTPGELVPAPLGKAGRLDWTAGASWVISSSVPGDPRWIGTAGTRWSLPRWGAVSPFLLASGDFGEASRARVAAGVALPIDMTITAEYRNEGLLAGTRHTIAAVLTLYF